jgi:hypothetical protein
VDRESLAFFAVLSAIYQRPRRRFPQESWAAGDPASEKTANRSLFFAVFVAKNSDKREPYIKAITQTSPRASGR